VDGNTRGKVDAESLIEIKVSPQQKTISRQGGKRAWRSKEGQKANPKEGNPVKRSHFFCNHLLGMKKSPSPMRRGKEEVRPVVKRRRSW